MLRFNVIFVNGALREQNFRKNALFLLFLYTIYKNLNLLINEKL